MQERVVFGRRGLAATAPIQAYAYSPPADRPAARSDSDDAQSGVALLFTRLFSTDGRISRRDYKIQTLAATLVYLAIVWTIQLSLPLRSAAVWGMPVSIIYLWILTATRIKRWHDRDKSAWWWLLSCTPIVGWVWGLVECRYLKGTAGPNRFGQDPANIV